jgi:hypothetical protein
MVAKIGITRKKTVVYSEKSEEERNHAVIYKVW